jgi:hypothetical protein
MCPSICLLAINRVSTVRMFPADMMDTLRTMIVQDPRSFLQLPRVKQELLVDKLTQRLVKLGSFCFL